MSESIQNSIIKNIVETNKDLIIRPNYGQASLSNWANTYDKIIEELIFIDKYSKDVASQINSTVSSQINSIHNVLKQLSSINEAQYVTSKQNLVNQIAAHMEQIKVHWPHYVVVAMEKSGLVSNINLIQNLNSITSKLEQETQKALMNINEKSQEIITKAKDKADEIEKSIKKTAEKISVKEAQDQFQIATLHNRNQCIAWGIITGLFVITFIITIYCLLKNIELPTTWTWQFGYYSVIRLSLLGFIATLIKFSLGLLKANMHMYHHNLHRKRITNSLASFVESATTKEQSDIILTKLVESITDFGNSGLIMNSEDIQKIKIDNFSRATDLLKGK